jgi:hypothetical protein
MNKNLSVRNFNQFSYYDLQLEENNNENINAEDLNDRLKCSDWIHHNQGRRGSQHLPSDSNGRKVADNLEMGE